MHVDSVDSELRTGNCNFPVFLSAFSHIYSCKLFDPSTLTPDLTLQKLIITTFHLLNLHIIPAVKFNPRDLQLVLTAEQNLRQV